MKINQLEQEVLRLINRHRLHLGLGELLVQRDLQQVARVHSRRMAEGLIPFGHQNFEERAKQLGQNLHCLRLAENVAEGQNDAETVLEAWLNSPPHRANIEGDFDWSGLGIWLDAKQRPYYTQIFARSAPQLSLDAQSFCENLALKQSQIRQSYGLAPFRGLQILDELAQEQAQDIAQERIDFGHQGFERRAERLKQNYLLKNMAENLALSRESPEAVLQSWLDSPPHKQNILGNFNYSGLGAAQDGQGNRVLVQIFAQFEEA